MSKSKELFSQIREEMMEEAIQDRIFIEADREEEYEKLKEEANKELGTIIVLSPAPQEKEIKLPF